MKTNLELITILHSIIKEKYIEHLSGDVPHYNFLCNIISRLFFNNVLTKKEARRLQSLIELNRPQDFELGNSWWSTSTVLPRMKYMNMLMKLYDTSYQTDFDLVYRLYRAYTSEGENQSIYKSDWLCNVVKSLGATNINNSEACEINFENYPRALTRRQYIRLWHILQTNKPQEIRDRWDGSWWEYDDQESRIKFLKMLLNKYKL